MEAASLVYSVAETLFAALQSQELKHICSLWNCESDLKRLQDTVDSIKCVLLDAEAKKELNHQQQDYVEKLKAAVYDADDLLDEFAALAEQQHHLLQRGKVSNKIRLMFSRFGRLDVFRKLSKNVKKIREELDGIATNASQFNFKVDYEPIRMIREDSLSYVHQSNVFGREKETEDIIKLLLAPDADVVKRDVSVLAIVGMGGLGKTTLAQHVYGHAMLKDEFDLRLWVCVSDQDPCQLLLQPVLAKMLVSATREEHNGTDVNLLQIRVREKLQGKKYLLVLDDLWIEDRNQWLNLENLLMDAGKGSRIMVTTRSEKTAQAVGSNSVYKLQELTEKSSWLLFKKVAFDGREEQSDCHGLEQIGREIVKKCSNVPLSIRVVGSLLCGQEKKMWQEFQQRGLAEITQGDKSLMPILKLSYHHLQPEMKCCFSYCALFPKDSVIEKETLIGLWMAQSFIKPLREGQRIEDAADEYFLILLSRCFFQDVKKDEFGEIVSCKMHDLMHDMAQQVAGNTIRVVDSATSTLDEKVCHVYETSNSKNIDSFIESRLRTFIKEEDCTFSTIQAIFTKCTHLRVLKLAFSWNNDMRNLLDTIGNHLHLRYIDLSKSSCMKKLPDSITQLPYLQTLILRDCSGLEELPRGLCKLAKLRHLDFEGCYEIGCMPSGMDKLTSLQRLTKFVVNEKSWGSDKCAAGLEDLRALEDLRGRLRVEVKSNFKYIKEERWKGGYLSNKKHLSSITISLGNLSEGGEELLELLQPHENVQELVLENYADTRMPGWATADRLETFLPNLVNIHLILCRWLKELPSFGKLQHLRCLRFDWLSDVEYMENTRSADKQAMLFPSLEKLDLYYLEVKGWWREPMGTHDHDCMSFPRLSELNIKGCPNLKSIFHCPMLKDATLKYFNDRIRIVMADEKEVGWYPGKQGDGSAHGGLRSGSLRNVEASNWRCLQSVLPKGALHNLKEMGIWYDEEIESLWQVGEDVLRSCSSSLRVLGLLSLPNMRNLCGGRGGGGFEHLTALKSLCLGDLKNLSFDEDPEEQQGMPWICLRGCLSSLVLKDLPKMKNMPKGMQHLTSLQSLYIDNVELEALPEWIGYLSSLKYLYLQSCRNLKSLPVSMRQLISLTRFNVWRCSQDLHQRCQSPDGEYRPLIQHIPYIDVD